MSNEQNDKDVEHKKEVTIVINGRQKIVEKEFLSFNEIVALAFENPPSGDGVQFTIQYTKGHSDKPKGTLLEDQSVKAKDGMEFDVTSTNRS